MKGSTRARLESGPDSILIDQMPIIRSVDPRRSAKVPAGRIAARVHNGAVRLLSRAGSSRPKEQVSIASPLAVECFKTPICRKGSKENSPGKALKSTAISRSGYERHFARPGMGRRQEDSGGAKGTRKKRKERGHDVPAPRGISARAAE